MYFTGLLPNVFPVAGMREGLAAVLSALGLGVGYKASSTDTVKNSNAVRRVFSRDGSVASLKRDLEQILGLLERTDAPNDFRVVVVLDELDKLDDDAMLDRVIQNFKNLFTLNRAVFVFITDKSYFDHIDLRQSLASSIQTYAAQHTFFTLKLFLPRPDYSDLVRFMDAIKDNERTTASDLDQGRWEEVVRYLAFESRSHFFDLMALLTELVELDSDKRPVLRLWPERVGGGTELTRKSRFQQMVELVYERDRYAGHNDDLLNNRLLGRLYSVFDHLAYPSFTDEQYRARRLESEEDRRERNAQRQLLALLKRCEAVEESPVAGNGRQRYAWKQRQCSEPIAQMLPLNARQQTILGELSDAIRQWEKVVEELR